LCGGGGSKDVESKTRRSLSRAFLPEGQKQEQYGERERERKIEREREKEREKERERTSLLCMLLQSRFKGKRRREGRKGRRWEVTNI
jgi:hypothetical protein